MLRIRVPLLSLLVSVAWLAGNSPAQTQPEIKGQRVFTVAHSFHAFMPPILGDIARRAEIKEHRQVGSNYIGVDVVTMSPLWLPDDGIENFVKLGITTNPGIRLFVQENWLPWDHYDAKLKPLVGGSDLTTKDGKGIPNLRPFIVGGDKHNAATGESLRTMHAPYFKEFDDHVAGLNKKYNTKAVRVAPVGQAVIALREKIIAGQAPGLKEQSDLFSDPLGHGKAPLMTLAGYVYYAAIYERSPVGLPVPAALAKAPEAEKLNRLLQEIAWQAVTEHPLSGVQAIRKR